jgi:hypothetical protein
MAGKKKTKKQRKGDGERKEEEEEKEKGRGDNYCKLRDFGCFKQFVQTYL